MTNGTPKREIQQDINIRALGEIYLRGTSSGQVNQF